MNLSPLGLARRHPVAFPKGSTGPHGRLYSHFMPPLTLYSTTACHLCELAKALLRGAEVSFEEVDVADSDALFERYGVRIPVLRHPDGRELGWPFGPEELAAFLTG